MSPAFNLMHSNTRHPSPIPPERLLKAQPLAALYLVRSDQMICGQLDDNILFHSFSSIINSHGDPKTIFLEVQ
jgi:transposase